MTSCIEGIYEKESHLQCAVDKNHVYGVTQTLHHLHLQHCALYTLHVHKLLYLSLLGESD